MKYIIFIVILSFSCTVFSESKKSYKCLYDQDKEVFVQRAVGSYTSTINKNNKNYYIGIKNTSDLSEVNDYLVIEEKKKSITYSLKCEVNEGEIDKSSLIL